MCICKKCKGYNYGRKNTIGSQEKINKSDDDNYIKNSLELLINLAERLNRNPYKKEYMKERNVYENYSISTLEHRLQMTYNDILKNILPQYKINRDKNVNNKQKLINDLRILRDKIGKVPTQSELYNNNITYGLNVYTKVFEKSYNEILINELGWQPLGHTHERKTDNELLEEFFALYNKLERIPTTTDHCRTGFGLGF
jgi:hypothetical protein